MTNFFPHSQRWYLASTILEVEEKNALHTVNSMGHLFSRSGLQASSSTWELVRNASSRASLQASWGEGVVNQPLQVILTALKLENHWVRVLGFNSRSCLQRAATNTQWRRWLGIKVTAQGTWQVPGRVWIWAQAFHFWVQGCFYSAK